MKKTLVNKCVLTSLLVFILTNLTFQVAAQSKIIKNLTMTVPFESPVAIKQLNSGSQNLDFGLEFNAEQEWFSNLSIELESNIDKEINYVQLELLFLSDDKDILPLVVPLSLGNPLDNNKQTSNVMSVKGSVAQINLNSKVSNLQEIVTSNGYSGDRLVIRIARVQYNDGTGWAHGRKTQRDPNNLLRWNILPYSVSDSISKLVSNVKYKKASFCNSNAKIQSETCYRWLNYEFINCGCNQQISSDNFALCNGNNNCNYRPVNTPYTCTDGTCSHVQSHLVTWYCDGLDES